MVPRAQLLNWPFRPSAPTTSVEERISLIMYAEIRSKKMSGQPIVDTVLVLTADWTGTF